INFEGIVSKALCVAEQKFRGLCKIFRIGCLPTQHFLGFGIAPWLMCDTAKCEPRSFYLIAFEFKCGCDRYQSKRVGKPISDFQIRVVRLKSLRRQFDRENEFVTIERRIAIGRVCWQSMKVGKGQDTITP